ncbi:RnfH family protein [Advenella mimigardefordensis]|uniref:RnfH family protein n=1 Tax=Advenella mimigardefordensis TaxID=302406 RepID=UPI0004B49D33|nr:RnfH family protein [Advenella mimigardefordensis]
MPEEQMTITVCYAHSAAQVWLSTITLPCGSTIEQAINASDVYAACNITAADIADIGVFGVRKSPDYVLRMGDRVELYRQLTFDPMESRRRRAAHRKAGILKRKHLKKSKVAWQEYMGSTPVNNKKGND